MSDLYWPKGNSIKRFLLVLGQAFLLVLGGLCIATTVYADGPVGLDSVFDWLSGDEADYAESVVAWGDIDGDGDLDLAMGTTKVRIYMNENGRLQENSIWVSAYQEQVSSLAWGDMDGDGDLDLAVGTLCAPEYEPRSTIVYLNVGGVLQVDPVWTGDDVCDKSTHSVAWGDVNGDGYLDLAVGNLGKPNKLYLNNSNGMLQTAPVWTDTVTDSTTSVAWGDMDGDGDLDLAVGNGGVVTRTKQPNKVYCNDGGELRATPIWTSSVSSATTSLVWGDIDSDGTLDLVVGNYAESNQIYLNSPPGGSVNCDSIATLATTTSWTSTLAYHTSEIALGDVDGDGDLDLAEQTRWWGSEPTSVYLNTGNTFSTIADWTADHQDHGGGIAWGDVDGDRDLDLAVGIKGRSMIYLNKAVLLQTTATTEWSDDRTDRTNSVAWGDVDGDGDLDLAVGNGISPSVSGGHNHIYLNQDGMLQSTPVWTSTIASTTTSIAWGDMDGDGDLDLAVGNYGSNSVYLNQASMLQSNPALTSTENDYTSSVAWGDVDGDGDLDLAVANGNDSYWSSSTPNRLYLNNDGTLESTATWTSAGDDCSFSVAWGDVDGDGDLDLAVGNRNAPNEIYLNQDGILPTTPGWQSNDEAPTYSVAWGDVDGDGDLDLAVGNFDHKNQIFLNVNGMLQKDADWLSWDVDQTYSVAWGDVDGDGDLDLAVGNSWGRWTSSKLYLNEGSALQSRATWLSADKFSTKSVAWGDVDGDGDLDLARGRWQETNMLYLNQRPAHPLHSGKASSLALGLYSDPIQTFNQTVTPLATAGFYAVPGIRQGTIPISYTLFNPTGRPVGRVAGFYSADGGGNWLPAVATDDTITQNVSVSTVFTTPITHTYTWDVLDSGFLGKSDNVVFRLVAYPLPLASKYSITGTHRYTRTIPGPYQQPYLAAQTYPFRVWGSQVRVFSATTPISNALVYHLPAGQLTGAEPYSRNTGEPFRTDAQGYLQGRGQINLGDQLFALSPHASDAVSSCTTFDSANVPKTISDSGTPTINSTLYAAGVGTIADVNVTVSGTHTWVGDLIFTLQSPGETSVQIMDSSCGYYDDFYLTLDDEAALTRTCPPTGGQTAQPSNPLSAFDGQTGTGEWTLTIQDIYPADGGSLDHWSLEICGEDDDVYSVYHTNAEPTLTSLRAFAVTQTGVQTLTVSANNSLSLFNLNVSLEWDARKDTAFLDQLDFDLRRVSEILFDASNGQAALGDVTVYHDKSGWDDTDVRIYANNALIPNADVGGIVTQDTNEIITQNPYVSTTLPYTITYRSGFARVGTGWGRSGSLDDDWSYYLAHELGHYLFYLNDNYIGLDQDGLVISVDSCTDSLMNDPNIYTEFHDNTDWSADCGNTISAQRTGRSDWDSITKFYPAIQFTGDNPGPVALPLAVTRIVQVAPSDAPATLDVPTLSVTDENGAVRQAGDYAQVILYHGERLVNLGLPYLDTVPALGAEPGDRLCIYDPSAQTPRIGCETISAGDNSLALVDKPGWQPEIIVTPVTSATFVITVTQVPTDVTLVGRLYPGNGLATPPVTFTLATAQAYSATIVLDAPADEGYIQVWVDEPESETNPRRETLTSYALGGSAGKKKCRGNRCRRPVDAIDHTQASGSFSPAISPDGQVLLYASSAFDKGEFYALQQATHLPDVPTWTTVVGNGYYVLASPGAPSLDQASINFRYRAYDVPPGEQSFVALYYWTGHEWEKLPTVLMSSFINEASAPCRGPGLYVLMSSLEIPIPTAGWNLISYPVQASREAPDALASIEGYYGLVYGYDTADADDPWKVYAPDPIPPWVNDLHTMEFGQGYWISSTQPITWELKGESDTVPSAFENSHSDGIRLPSGYPTPPATFYGVVSPTASFAPTAGMTVSAYIEGILCGQGKTMSVGDDVVYSINVGYGIPGQIVTFQIGSTMMSATAEWNNNNVWQVPLYLTQAPTISDIADQTTQASTPLIVTFAISDTNSELDNLWLYAESSNLSLVNGELNGTLMMGGGIRFGGSGMTRTATITPTDGLTGTTTITITVDDGELTDSDSFVLTVFKARIYLPLVLR